LWKQNNGCILQSQYIKMLESLINWIIQIGGFYMLLFVIFAETGLFAGFFLPGDSLLVVAGIYSSELATTFFNAHYIVLFAAVAAAAILGNLCGYWFGSKSGPFLYERKDTFLFKKKHLLTAKKFYDKHGTTAIILGRFLPFVRTFAPIVAGIVKVPYRKFVLDSIIGAVLWVFSMMLAGKFLQSWLMDNYNFDLRKNVEPLALGIIFVTTAPVIYKFIKEGRQQANTAE
jgi:membrane-associated protein